MGLLDGKVALVTGASRGIGRGTALALAAEGAAVVITARTMTSARSAAGERALGTLEETVAQIRAAGGDALAVPADLADEARIRYVVEETIARHGRVDLLVNNAMGVPRDIEIGEFWRTPAGDWDVLNVVGPRSHYLASYHAAPHMVRQGSGLIVNISAAGAFDEYYQVAFRVAHAATARLAKAMAADLRPHRVAALALWPRWVRTERVLRAARGELEGMTVRAEDLAISDSPELIGRVVARLAADPDVLARSGRILLAVEVAREYGLADTNGKVPTLDADSEIWGRRLREIESVIAG